MKDFKFLKNPLIHTHDGAQIYAGDVFYSMNKEDMESVLRPGTIIPKYTIVRRRVDPKFKDVFKPDHEALWYFRSKDSAEWLKEVWIRQDEQSNYLTIR
jgi:hypothetical protein